MPHHLLKIWPEHFKAVVCGEKRAELRRDDRSPAFDRHDTLELREWNPATGHFTGDGFNVKVTHAARGEPIPAGFVLLSIMDADAWEDRQAFRLAERDAYAAARNELVKE